MFMAQIRDYPEIKMIKDTNATRNLEMLEDKINGLFYGWLLTMPCPHKFLESWFDVLFKQLPIFKRITR
ncbi:hypothetical protein HanXRQr2_Chr09g0383211 [Helianthus annuus]|uniref:Uncharacterized protein n=1 Tax=Helianthus annuus TaxID=4232 RepID=A0A9K3I5S7_HELAN|nr:hypothetical protein HanXRQr2_Chr09g0383211 [Helianthus annuus]KAJ0892718.1 hypothetical protein HanPSC8_Chr09g0369291 [Helianthus annuus]